MQGFKYKKRLWPCMPVILCPHCSSKVYFDQHDYSDINHKCQVGGTTIQKEPRTVIGNYIDENTGQTIQRGRTFQQGIGNKIQGSKAAAQGVNVSELNAFGLRTYTHRLRDRIVNINLKPFKPRKRGRFC